MAQKIVEILDIGEVILSKRRGARNIRLSVNSAGKVRVGLPVWMPYSAGIIFARQRAAWIKKHLNSNSPKLLGDGAKIGKYHSLLFKLDRSKKRITTKIADRKVIITTPWPYNLKKVQERAERACEKALAVEANELLIPRLKFLSQENGFKYKKVEVKKLRSRWGSYSSNGTLTLSIYLVQLPWQFIDYVLLHELVHTQHMNHSAEFWERLNRLLPQYKSLKKQMKLYKPSVNQIIE